jgi:hypothetical protein
MMNVTPIKNGAAPKPALPTSTPSRMTLGNITKGRIDAPLRVLLYGVEGVGKSTFAMRAPSPIFLNQEKGTEELSVARFPEPQRWDDVLDGVRALEAEPSEYKTLVIDPVNWLEPLCWAKVCAKNGWQTIDEPGYGKGFDAALDEWRVFLSALDRLRHARGMHIILIAHAQVKSFTPPEAEASFDRYQIAMNQKAAGLLKQWSSAVLFAKHEVYAHKDKTSKRIRGVSSGARQLFTQWTAAYDAKNRYHLPETLPLSWEEFFAAVEAGRSNDPAEQKARADAARERIATLVAELGDSAYAARATKAVADAGDDGVRLAEIENRVATRVASRTENTESTNGEGQ